MRYKGIEILPKFDGLDKDSLSIIYTPGVGACSKAIAEDRTKVYELTNKANSVCVVGFDYSQTLERAIVLKETLNIDAYPIIINSKSERDIKFVVENMEPGFCGFDLTLLGECVSGVSFNVEIPVMIQQVEDVEGFFNPVSKNLFMTDFSQLGKDSNERAMTLRRMAQGVLETSLTEELRRKPVAIISDGSAVLGLGNIGAEAGIPVMEGKAFLLKALADIDAMPICIKTQDAQEIIKLVLLIEESFSGVNLEDICAPKCFEVERVLIEKASIVVFHDDQHGSAIVVLAGILNALTLVEKDIQTAKIVMSGAGAAACATARLLVKAGARNIILTDIDGVVYKGRPQNNTELDSMCDITNPANLKGALKDVIVDTDVFVGLSAGGVLSEDMVKMMAQEPIIFALANPSPEIMPDKAKQAGAFIVATGRSDFDNQVNNSLAFPGIFRGALDNNVKVISDEMKVNSAIAIASLVEDDELASDYIMPDALGANVVKAVASSIF